MNNIKLLDVTLRDGGYKTNFHFPLETVEYTLKALDQSGVHYIEVGYRNGPLKLTSDIGPAGICPRAYLEYCKKLVQTAKLTVIFHPKNIQQYDLEEMRDCGVDSVRICLPPQNPALGFKSIDIAKKNNLEVFANIVRISQYTREQIRDLVIELAKHEIKAVYLADSNGSLTPKETGDLFAYIKENCSAPLGFHAHDNLFLAQANTLAAIQEGAQFIDASLFGIGKGAGNSRTEGIASFLSARKINQYDLCKLLEAAEYVKTKLCDTNASSAKDIILGVFDLSQDDALNLGEFFNIKEYHSLAEKYYQNIKSNGTAQ